MEPEPLLYRNEATSALFAIYDMNGNVQRIRDLLEEELRGEEEEEEDTS